MLRSQP